MPGEPTKASDWIFPADGSAVDCGMVEDEGERYVGFVMEMPQAVGQLRVAFTPEIALMLARGFAMIALEIKGELPPTAKQGEEVN